MLDEKIVRHYARPQTSLGELPGKISTYRAGGRFNSDSQKTLLSLFDYSGTWAKPFADAGWIVHQWDIKLSEFMDINFIEDAETALELFENVNGIIAAPPCTDFSSSGAHAWKFKDEDGRTQKSVELVAQVQRLVNLFAPTDPEYDEPWFWAVENPVGRMGELTGLGKPWYFQPCEFAGWLNPKNPEILELDRIRQKSMTQKITRQEGDFVMQMEAYTKKTGLWGAFKIPQSKSLEPVYVTSTDGKRFSPVAWFTGGKSDKTKELRSNTPLGFAMAFYEANKDFRAQFQPGYWEEQGWSEKEAKKIYKDYLRTEPGEQKKLFRKGGSANSFPELRTSAAFEIIDADENLAGGDWTAGACHPLALALKDIYGGDLVVIKADGIVQHVMVKIGDKYIDADGLQDEATKLKNFELDSMRLRNEWIAPPFIAEFKQEQCGNLGQGSKETIEKIKQLLRPVAPNGQPSNPSSPDVRLAKGGMVNRKEVINSPEFKKWFKKSVVVDGRGQPKIMYHGTRKDFSVFDISHAGKTTHHETSALGFFFTGIKIAQSFAYPTWDESDVSLKHEFYEVRGKQLGLPQLLSELKNNYFRYFRYNDIKSKIARKEDRIDREWNSLARQYSRKIDFGSGANLMPVYLSIQKPFEMTAEQILSYGSFDRKKSLPTAEQTRKKLIEQGYDGILIKKHPDLSEFEFETYVAFYPEQIKSVFNTGAFDSSNSDVRLANGGPTRPLAPNGRPSNLTAEQYLLVRTPAFKAWFGDWEKLARVKFEDSGIDEVTLANLAKNVSKIVDENGEPAVVFHGTSNLFTEFDIKKTGQNTGNYGHHGYGAYFSFDKREALGYANGHILECFAKSINPFTQSEKNFILLKQNGIYWLPEIENVSIEFDSIYNQMLKKDAVAAYLMKCINEAGYEKGWSLFLEKYSTETTKLDLNDLSDLVSYTNSRNGVPDYVKSLIESLNLNYSEVKFIKGYVDSLSLVYNVTLLGERSKEFTETIQKLGFDAVQAGSELVLFNPTQIKLADGTNTTFDGANPDVRFKAGGIVEDKKSIFKKWSDLVNMTAAELEKFYNSEEGKRAGLKPSEAKDLGIHYGRESARWIIKMKTTPVSEWTPDMWQWAQRQINFNTRMLGNKGPLYDDSGKKTRKHTSLLIWGHNPEKFADGGQLELFDEIKEVTEDEISAVKDNFKATPESVRLLRLENPDPQLTFFSFGGGQDSWCILYKMLYDPDFRKKYAPNDLVIGMSDTGNEFPYTYQYLKEAMALADSFGIHFQFITPDQGFHTEGWPNLKHNLKKNDNILSAQMQRQPCTVNLKINVVDKYMHHYMCQKYFPDLSLNNKNGWKLYREKFQSKARVLIGFATDEEKRVEKSHRMHLAKNKEGKPVLPKWKTDNIQYVYPMVEEGWNRAAAQDIILQYRKDLPPPSNCMICFYQSDQELLWLERNYPLEFYDWVELERRKLEKFKHLEKNYGVYGSITLLQRLEMAKAKFGHLSDEQLWEYKMSHGHCVKSAY